MFEILTSVLLIISALMMGLALIGFAARQWRKMKRGG